MTDTENTSTEVAAEDAPVVYEKGSWQEALQKSTTLKERAGKANKNAGVLLWKGATEGINSWLPNSATDVSGEGLYQTVIEALGKSRKGDASKIKTVAVAVRNHSLDISVYPNLSKAYAAANDLTKGAQEREKEDDAAETAIEAIEAPKTASTVEASAKIVLSKGVDGAVVALLDALGAQNEAAHRAFMRAVSTEVAARAKAVADAAAAAKKAAAAANKPASTPKKGATTAKKATPVKAKKATPVKPKPKAAAEVEVSDEAPTVDDMFAEVEAEDSAAEVEAAPVKPAAKKVSKGRPVVKRPRS